MVSGLGYGLIKKDDEYYYNANYKGYTFQLKTISEDIEQNNYNVNVYEEYDEDGNGIGDPTEQEVEHWDIKDNDISESKLMVHLNDNIFNDEDYLTWCLENILGYAPSLIEETIKNDIDYNPAGTQWDYNGDVYIYDNDDTFKKRAIVWANENVTDEQLDVIINVRIDEIEDIDMENDTKIEKITKYLNTCGTDCGLYSTIKTTPDKKIIIKL